MATALSTEAMRVAQNDTYQKRVKHFATKAAVAIMAEDPATASHTERVTWANSELKGEEPTLQQTISTLTNDTLKATANVDAENQGIEDAELEFTVNSQVNAWAGVAQQLPA